MKTSGLVAPPEIWVIRLARLVSVSVGAERSVTWIPGWTFSKLLISTVRGSGVEVVIGLVYQTMLPLVADPAGLAGPPDELGVLDDEPPHAASASVRTAASEARGARPRSFRTVMLCFLPYCGDLWWRPMRVVTVLQDRFQLVRQRCDGRSGRPVASAWWTALEMARRKWLALAISGRGLATRIGLLESWQTRERLDQRPVRAAGSTPVAVTQPLAPSARWPGWSRT